MPDDPTTSVQADPNPEAVAAQPAETPAAPEAGAAAETPAQEKATPPENGSPVFAPTVRKVAPTTPAIGESAAAPNVSPTSPTLVESPAVTDSDVAPAAAEEKPAPADEKFSVPEVPPEPPAPPRDENDFNPIDRPPDQGVIYQTPELPLHFAPRVEFNAIKKLLLSRPGASLAPVTLQGYGGAGKTALAIALAHDADILKTFPDGVLWVSLGEGADIQIAQAVWGSALGNDLSQLPDAASRTAALRSLLADRICLMVIDDATDIEQIKALNVGGSNCVRIITTDHADEAMYALKTRRYTLDKMSESEALALITAWAGILPDIYLPTVKEISKRLGYSAIALALVGAQARQGITWLRLLEVLRDDQGPIANINSDSDELRLKGLKLIINVVLSRFGGAQLQRLALMGIFAAGAGTPFSYEAAGMLWDMSPADARSTLDLAVESALVQRLPGGLYVVHPVLRDYLRKSATPTLMIDAMQRVRTYYLQLVEQATLNSKGVDAQIGQIMHMFREATLDTPEYAARLADVLVTYFEQRGLWANMVQLVRSAVEVAVKAEDEMREHQYLPDLGFALTILNHFDEARTIFERSLELSRKLGDPAGEASALNNIGAISERDGEHVEAEQYYRQSLAIRQQIGGEDEVAEDLNNIAGSLLKQGRWDEALNAFQRVLDMYSVLGDRSGQASTELNIGTVYENMNSDWEALNAYQRSLAIYANRRDEEGESQALNNIGIVYLNQGDTERALGHFKRSLVLKEKLGDQSGQAATLNNIALLYEKTNSLSLALEHYERANALLVAMGDPRAEVVQENINKLKSQA
jgi:tetratricopeptide (TPR) repeat protein